MKLVEIPNSRLKQYYYDVIKELHDIGIDDISTTEHFYYDVQYCYEMALDVSECVYYLIEIKEKTNERIYERCDMFRVSSHLVLISRLFPNQ